ncbi:MAG: hypothetical protein Q8R92_20745, partial [Deltaproteobacteria bacterium]|nr:hypothetical protein [Deltaproteobacteria bacterium]
LARTRTRRARRYTPGKLPPPTKGRPPNACRPDWPGGYNFFGWRYTPWRFETQAGKRVFIPGTRTFTAKPPGWLWTGFDAQGPTNPKCYPPRGQQHQDTANDGTFAGARRAATLGHENPEAIARAINGITRAMAAGKITEGRAGALIGGLMTPSMAAAQAGERIQPLTAADIAARKAAKGTRFDLLGALSLREVADACRKRPGPWACFERWPGGWLAFDDPRVGAGTGPWHGPTPYGVFLPGCFGHKYDPVETVGRWIIKTVGAAPSAIAQPLARIWQALVPTPEGTPVAAPAPPADLWMCRESWPGGWMPVPEYLRQGSPAGWRGPTPYGVPVPGCFGGV